MEELKRLALRAWRAVLDFCSDEEDPEEPFYDPVHLGAVCIVCLVVTGALYWLLWTLLVFEGGLFAKILPALKVLFTSAKLKDFGYEGSPYAMGVFEGWLANMAALLLSWLVLWALLRLFRAAQKNA